MAADQDSSKSEKMGCDVHSDVYDQIVSINTGTYGVTALRGNGMNH